jgi:hypothetical protein
LLSRKHCFTQRVFTQRGKGAKTHKRFSEKRQRSEGAKKISSSYYLLLLIFACYYRVAQYLSSFASLLLCLFARNKKQPFFCTIVYTYDQLNAGVCPLRIKRCYLIPAVPILNAGSLITSYGIKLLQRVWKYRQPEIQVFKRFQLNDAPIIISYIPAL